MKILSNFDTGLASELYNEAVERHGEDQVMLIKRDVVYVYVKILPPFIVWGMIGLGLMIWSYSWPQDSTFEIIRWVVFSVIILGMIVIFYRVISKIIDYSMDFTLITPREILSYDQSGLFKRKSTSLELQKIKSVNIEKDGLLRSLLNFGSIVFFSEGDTIHEKGERLGNVKLNYIKYPRKVRERIVDLIKNE